MRVDHGRADIGVTEQFLYSPNISLGLQEMRGEAVAKCVRAALGALRANE